MDENPFLAFNLLSDLHAEFYNNIKPLVKILDKMTKTDILILAGDIGYPLNKKGKCNQSLYQLLQECKKRFPIVLYVAGNHEYFQAVEHKLSVAEIDQALESMCDEIGVTYLKPGREDVIYHGVKFLGCTLYSQTNPKTWKQMNDYRIGSLYEILKLHQQHVEWLDSAIEESKHPTVVVTHYLPTFKAMHEKYKSIDYIDTKDGYYTDLEFMFRKPVIAWVAGHTHECIEVTVNNIPLFVNPVGYPGEKRQTTLNKMPYVVVCTNSL